MNDMVMEFRLGNVRIDRKEGSDRFYTAEVQVE